jgi:DNA-binding XRE family transcriptional regulator
MIDWSEFPSIEPRATFGRRLWEWRDRQRAGTKEARAPRLSQAELARRLGTGREAVRLWEKGQTWPNVGTVEALNQLGANLDPSEARTSGRRAGSEETFSG